MIFDAVSFRARNWALTPGRRVVPRVMLIFVGRFKQNLVIVSKCSFGLVALVEQGRKHATKL
jgi:hypothetical protein